MVIPAFSVAAIMSFVCGVIIMMQAPINARLGSVMGGPIWAAFLSFLVGTVALAVVLFIGRKSPPPLENIFQTSAWMWIGGLLGALFVFTTIFSVPKLGAGLMIVLIIAGQMACAIAMDHYGFLVEERSVSLMRIAGAGLVMAGAWLVYKG